MKAIELLNETRSIFAPPKNIGIADWSDKNRILPAEGADEAGQWRTDRAPYQRGIMDAITEKGIWKVVIKSATQCGKSEILMNTMFRYADIDPSPILFAAPTTELAQDFSRDRVDATIRDTPKLRELFSSYKKRSSLSHKPFRGGFIKFSGGNSPNSLCAKPIRIALVDEVSRFPRSVSTAGNPEGSPLRLIEKRLSNFADKKMILASTPTTAGACAITAEYNLSDRKKRFVPCKQCNTFYVIDFDQMVWETEEDEIIIESARIKCDICQTLHTTSDILASDHDGEWRATSNRGQAGVAGFELPQFYSPWSSLEEILTAYKNDKDDIVNYQTFVNTYLAKEFSSLASDKPDWESLYKRRESYPIGQIPKQVSLLTCGVDVQANRLELTILGFHKKESWIIDSYAIPASTGSTANLDDECWKRLDALIDYKWEHPNGGAIALTKVAVDSGYNTQTVYNYVRRHSPLKVHAIKGSDSLDVPISIPRNTTIDELGKKVNRGVLLWLVGSSVIKADIYARLNLPLNEDGTYPAQYIHFPELGAEFFQQLTNEQLELSVDPMGQSKLRWRRLGPNEALDTVVYANAMYTAAQADRFTDAKWNQLSQRTYEK